MKFRLLLISIYCLLIHTLLANTEKPSAHFEGEIKNIVNCVAGNCDSIFLEVYDNYIGSGEIITSPTKYAAIIRDGRFEFNIPNIKRPSYCNLKINMGLASRGKDLAPIFKLFLLEPGDSVKMSVDVLSPVFGRVPTGNTYYIRYLALSNVLFSGPGSVKFILTFEKDAHEQNVMFSKLYFSTIKNEKKISKVVDSLYNSKLWMTHLENSKSKISPIAYQILKADLQYDLDYYTEGNKEVFPDSVLALSKNWADYTLYYLKRKGIGKGAKSRYDYIKANYKNEARDKLLLKFFISSYAYWPVAGEADMLIDEALSMMQDQRYYPILNKLKKNQESGGTAYNFSLPDVRGNYIQLKNFQGKTVFIDFWYTGCGPCQSFYKNRLSKVEKYFEQDTSVVFITIAIDFNKKGWTTSVNNGDYTSPNSPNVVNLYTEGKAEAHPVIQHYGVTGYPRPIIIDKYGKVFRSNNLRLPSEKLVEIIQDAMGL